MWSPGEDGGGGGGGGGEGGGGGGGGQFTRHFIADILAEDSPLSPLPPLSPGLSITDQEDPARIKKQRTSFSGWQIYELERIFEEKKYINSEERKDLARSVLWLY